MSRKTGTARVEPYLGTASGNDWPSAGLGVDGPVYTAGATLAAHTARPAAVVDNDIPADDFGWEEAVLHNLCKRLFDAE
jgi:hypothetical protein